MSVEEATALESRYERAWRNAYRALDATEWKPDGCVPRLGRLLDEVVDRIAQLCVLADVRIGEVCEWDAIEL